MKKEYNDRVKTYCKCGRFLYEQIGEETSFPKGVNVTTNGIKFKVRCKCGEITKFDIK